MIPRSTFNVHGSRESRHRREVIHDQSPDSGERVSECLIGFPRKLCDLQLHFLLSDARTPPRLLLVVKWARLSHSAALTTTDDTRQGLAGDGRPAT